MKKILAVVALTLGFVMMATNAFATTPVYSGYGWKILTRKGIHSIHPDGYTIYFASDLARDRMRGHLNDVADQLASVTGVSFNVNTSTLRSTGGFTSCPARHEIIVSHEYRPMGEKGMSQALPCYSTYDNSAWGGYVRIDGEYWREDWFSTNDVLNKARRLNAITHEVGHVIGLDHPNKDLDRDGSVEAHECEKTYYGYLPVMCAPKGGYTGSKSGGEFTSIDKPGLRQLEANYGL